MTGPFPGQGETPQPWGGRPPESGSGGRADRGGMNWDGQPTDPIYVDAGYRRSFTVPPDGPNRLVVAAIAVGVVVVVGAGLALWFGSGPGHQRSLKPIAATSSRPPPPANPVVHPPTSASSTPDGAAAYDVGSCFDEAAGGAPGTVELNPVPCGSDDAVFVINSIATTSAGCDSGADYRDHGYEVPDETANVAYCASLVVPVNVCFVLGGSAPIARTACGSGPDAVQVLAIESAPSAATACTDKPDPDVWYYQAPTSGQFACVSRPAATSTSGAATPTTTPAG